MSLGYSSLSTTLSMKHSPAHKEDDSKQRFRKVSLVSDARAAKQDSVDRITSQNGSDPGSEYKWRNRFDGVSQYTPGKTDASSLWDSAYSSSSSVPPEATALRLSDRTEVYLSCESKPAREAKAEWGRSCGGREESAAGETEGRRVGEAERFGSCWESHQLSVSGFSGQQTTESVTEEEEEDNSRFTGVFQAELVELSDPPAPLSPPPASPEVDSPGQFDMESLVDTLKSMGPSMRPRSLGLRGPQVLMSALPPIVEDAPSPATSVVSPSLTGNAPKIAGAPTETFNGLYTLPADVGLRNSNRDTRSPLDLMKLGLQVLYVSSGFRCKCQRLIYFFHLVI